MPRYRGSLNLPKYMDFVQFNHAPDNICRYVSYAVFLCSEIFAFVTCTVGVIRGKWCVAGTCACVAIPRFVVDAALLLFLLSSLLKLHFFIRIYLPSSR